MRVVCMYIGRSIFVWLDDVLWVLLVTEMDPEQTGPLVAPAALPSLTAQQLQALQMAKKYCYDITAKFVTSSPRAVLPVDTSMVFFQPQPKQNDHQVVQMVALQEAANKQRALLLMSRWVRLVGLGWVWLVGRAPRTCTLHLSILSHMPLSGSMLEVSILNWAKKLLDRHSNHLGRSRPSTCPGTVPP